MLRLHEEGYFLSRMAEECERVSRLRPDEEGLVSAERFVKQSISPFAMNDLSRCNLHP